MVESLGWLNQNQTDKLSVDDTDKLNLVLSDHSMPNRRCLIFPLCFPICFPAPEVLETNQEDKLTESLRGS